MSTDYHRTGASESARLRRFADIDTPEVAFPRAAITAWLLDGGAQQTRGPEIGAVAGWVGTDGRVEYFYPEITGYFLQWLAFSTTANTRVACARRAALAQDWLRSWLRRSALPLTRIYADGREDDWRNRALFCFDLAMVLRGLASAAGRELIAPDREVVHGLCGHLERLIASDGCFDACRAHDGEALPSRWSTHRGGFLAKAAAGIIAAARHLEIPVVVQRAAEATYAASLQAALAEPHDETHPFLYAFEGLLARRERADAQAALPAMAAQLRDLLDDFAQRGRLREARSYPGLARLDIVAQCIRVALLLLAWQPQLAPEPERIDALLHRLASSVRADGALPFCADAVATTQCNTWTAMFSDQAFALAQASHRATSYFDPLLI